jgi:hypothetical protein
MGEGNKKAGGSVTRRLSATSQIDCALGGGLRVFHFLLLDGFHFVNQVVG